MLKLLKEKGFRITKPRQYMMQVLGMHPLTAEELFQELKNQKLKIDLTSVYRSLELFTALGIVQTVDFSDGKKRYELAVGRNHHHHIVCSGCGRVDDIEVDEHSLLTSVKMKKYYQITGHNLEFFGLCSACR